MAKRRRSNTPPSPKMEEVTDLEAVEAGEPSGLTLEAGLIFVTFLALITGVVLCQMVMRDKFGMGFLS